METTLKVGDKVIVPKYSGTQLDALPGDAKILGEDLYLIPESEILAVLED